MTADFSISWLEAWNPWLVAWDLSMDGRCVCRGNSTRLRWSTVRGKRASSTKSRSSTSRRWPWIRRNAFNITTWFSIESWGSSRCNNFAQKAASLTPNWPSGTRTTNWRSGRGSWRPSTRSRAELCSRWTSVTGCCKVVPFSTCLATFISRPRTPKALSGRPWWKQFWVKSSSLGTTTNAIGLTTSLSKRRRNRVLIAAAATSRKFLFSKRGLQITLFRF